MESHEQVILMLGEIRGDVKGIHQRLDVSNGRLLKHDQALQELKTYQDTQSGQTKILASIWGCISAAAVSLIVYFITKNP